MPERTRHEVLTLPAANLDRRNGNTTAHLASSALPRLRFLAGSAAAGTLGLLLTVAAGCAEPGVAADAQTSTSRALPAKSGTAADDNAIRPFRINVSEEVLADLRRRIAATRWPEMETVADQSQGVQLATIRELARYWATDYDCVSSLLGI